MGNMIVVEGIDGAGKTTHAMETVRRLNEGGIFSAYYAKSPIGSKKGELEILNFFLSNTVFYQKVLLPKMSSYENKIVVLDRWIGSFLNYFCFVQGFSIEFLECLNKSLMGSFLAANVFLLDISPEIAAERISKKKKQSKFDKMGIDFLEKQRNGFLVLAEKYNWRVIDGSKSVEETQKELCSLITPLL